MAGALRRKHHGMAPLHALNNRPLMSLQQCGLLTAFRKPISGHIYVNVDRAGALEGSTLRALADPPSEVRRQRWALPSPAVGVAKAWRTLAGAAYRITVGQGTSSTSAAAAVNGGMLVGDKGLLFDEAARGMVRGAAPHGA